jgi:hypothetical protein
VKEPNERFVEGIEALAEAFEAAGRTDLSALCDRAAYWLSGGSELDLMSVKEVVDNCRETLEESLANETTIEDFLTRTASEVVLNVQEIQSKVVVAARTRGKRRELLERAARVQALAILASRLL